MKSVFLLSLAFLLQGCISSKFVSSSLIDKQLKLEGEIVYIYNTLDIRTEEFSQEMLVFLNQQIVSRFKEKNVSTNVFNFKESKVGTTYMVAGSGTIPIDQFTSQYKSQEVDNNVNFRLLVIPSQMTVSGPWRFFTISWILVDVDTGLVVWKGVSKGEHLVQFTINEMAEKRASQIVDGLFAELEKAKLFYE